MPLLPWPAFQLSLDCCSVWLSSGHNPARDAAAVGLAGWVDRGEVRGAASGIDTLVMKARYSDIGRRKRHVAPPVRTSYQSSLQLPDPHDAPPPVPPAPSLQGASLADVQHPPVAPAQW